MVRAVFRMVVSIGWTCEGNRPALWLSGLDATKPPHQFCPTWTARSGARVVRLTSHEGLTAVGDPDEVDAPREIHAGRRGHVGVEALKRLDLPPGPGPF